MNAPGYFSIASGLCAVFRFWPPISKMSQRLRQEIRCPTFLSSSAAFVASSPSLCLISAAQAKKKKKSPTVQCAHFNKAISGSQKNYPQKNTTWKRFCWKIVKRSTNTMSSEWKWWNLITVQTITFQTITLQIDIWSWQVLKMVYQLITQKEHNIYHSLGESIWIRSRKCNPS